ncbi:MAG TPA: lipid II flippase MurJ, partial [Micromonosporaceae bacterium]|nr:lipid II flippase MurJ [Micromonosporaceae bacterium]
SRLAGFGRTAVFTWTLAPTDLGGTYVVANAVPNIIFEIVAGGALASLVVPLLAGAVERGDRQAVSATTSALLTWTLALLVAAAVVVALAAGPVMRGLSPASSPEEVAVGVRMLRVFAPQLPLYGVGIVLTGVLQAHHRFAWPVLAPLLSSVTVVAAYVTFALVQGRGTPVAGLGRAGELVLSAGTTLGVAVLSLCLVVPLRGLALRIRPSLRFPAAARRAVGGLALAGAVTVAAQQLALVVVLRLALAGAPGTVVLVNLAQTIFLLPWAVLAVPVATAAYPVLAAAGANGETIRYRDTLAGAVRGVVLLCFLGVAALAALAWPAAATLAAVMPAAGAPDVGALAAAIAGFAPGLLGYGLFAVLSRALYARGDTALAAGATVAGWAAVAFAAVALAAALPTGERAVALAGANAVGMSVLGAALLVVTARRAGTGALAGLGRTALAGLAGGLAAALAGLAVPLGLTARSGHGTPAVGDALPTGMLSGVAVVAVFLSVAYVVDRRDLAPMLAGVRARLRRRQPTREEARGRA